MGILPVLVILMGNVSSASTSKQATTGTGKIAIKIILRIFEFYGSLIKQTGVSKP
jgi:hypothetical protein